MTAKDGGSDHLRQGYGGPPELDAKAEEQNAPYVRRPGLILETGMTQAGSCVADPANLTGR